MRISHSGKKPVVITGGDPSGIGPEVILKSLLDPAIIKETAPLVIGDYKVFQKNARKLKIDIALSKSGDKRLLSTDGGWINFIDLANVPAGTFRFGAESALYGKAAMEYLTCGISVLKELNASSLVTAPINKASINKAGFDFEGHTEFLSHVAGAKGVTMMLVGGALKVSLVTRHVPIKNVARCITKAKVAKTIADTHYALKCFFKIPRPRIGVAGLNPHAGEGGLLGTEEKTKILPAVVSARKGLKGSVAGPLPSDTLFYKAYRNQLDAVVCMYHDQGLIPLKMIAFEKGVNMTVGLPFVRTSPDHGTGFDIAGKGKANPSSMTEAIKLAARFSARQP